MSKQKTELQLAGILINRDSDTPLYYQLYLKIRNAISEGRFRPGQKLPATRELATELGISRTTVVLAFDYLLEEGYLQGKIGSGTYITADLPDSLLKISNSKLVTQRATGGKARLSRRGQIIKNTTLGTTPLPEVINPFRPGLPSLKDFPCEIWAKIAGRELRNLSPQKLGYGDPAGYQPLRETIAMYLRTTRAAQCEPEQVIILNGSQQALELAARLLLDAGETAWVEDPCYPGAKSALTAAGLALIAVPVDDQGLNVAEGIKNDPHSRLIYVTPSHQFPLGITMSLRRRLELLEWATQNNIWILEDDYDSEYRYTSPPLSSLQGLDKHDRVIYMGTFSKVLFPGLRLGYLVVPHNLIDAFISAKALSTVSCPILDQVVLTEFINEGHFGRHVRRMRMLYKEKQHTLIEAVKQELDELLEIHPTEGGIHKIAFLKDGWNDSQVSELASKYDIIAPPLSAYCVQYKRRPALVLGYAPFDKNEIKNGVNRLAEALNMNH